MLIDSHCHLDLIKPHKSVEAVLATAREAGVHEVISICTTMEGFEDILGYACSFPDVFCTVGVHPHQKEEVTAEVLVRCAQHPRVVGLGETGLDFFYENSDRAHQERNLCAHVEAAQETGLPLVIHARSADEALITLLERAHAASPLKGVIHCFSSGERLARAAVAMGFMISLSGILTFKKAEELRGIVRSLPLDHLLLETDAPYLAPVPLRGRTNEPAYMAHTAQCLAELHGLSLDAVIKTTRQNTLRLFQKMPQLDPSM